MLAPGVKLGLSEHSLGAERNLRLDNVGKASQRHGPLNEPGAKRLPPLIVRSSLIIASPIMHKLASVQTEGPSAKKNDLRFCRNLGADCNR